MAIANDTVVLIHYTLKNDAGEVLDSSDGREPLGFIYGKGAIIKGLESALSDKKEGDSFSVSIPPEEAYGRRQDDMVQDVPLTQFEDKDAVKVGVQFQLPEQGLIAEVKAVTEETATLDMNHPLADETLHFDVTVESTREATKEELEHGHPQVENAPKE